MGCSEKLQKPLFLGLKTHCITSGKPDAFRSRSGTPAFQMNQIARAGRIGWNARIRKRDDIRFCRKQMDAWKIVRTASSNLHCVKNYARHSRRAEDREAVEGACEKPRKGAWRHTVWREIRA